MDIDMTFKTPAHLALLNYTQADEDGVMVLVSRQAIHEVSAEITRLRTRLYEAEKVIKPFADEVDCYTPIIPDHYVTSVTLDDLRAAAKWMEAKQ